MPGLAGAPAALAAGAGPVPVFLAVGLFVAAVFPPAWLASILLVTAAGTLTLAVPLASLFLPQAPLVLVVAALAATPLFLRLGDGVLPWRALLSYALAVALIFLAIIFARWSPTFIASDAAGRAQVLALVIAAALAQIWFDLLIRWRAWRTRKMQRIGPTDPKEQTAAPAQP